MKHIFNRLTVIIGLLAIFVGSAFATNSFLEETQNYSVTPLGVWPREQLSSGLRNFALVLGYIQQDPDVRRNPFYVYPQYGHAEHL